MENFYPRSRRYISSQKRRLKGYDYSSDGFYFITIDCKGMECRFGKIVGTSLMMSEFGKIAYNQWFRLPERYQNIVLHDFQIMPNHLHGIIEIVNTDQEVSKRIPLFDMIGAYKSIVSNECLVFHKSMYAGLNHIPLMRKIWKRSFYDHIIRDYPSYKSISRYIRNNPKKWNRQ